MKTHCLLALCALLAGSVTASPILNVIDRIARVHGGEIHDDLITTMRELEITNRNVDEWMKTFKTLNSAYVKKIGDNDLTTENPKANPFVCTEHVSLAKQLQEIITQWEKTWAGWKAKHDLLELIWGLLTKNEGGMKEQSGLHCGGGSGKQAADAKQLCDMLTKLRNTSKTEKALLEKEKKTLDGHKKNLDNYECDCTFSEWDGDFGQCEGGSGDTAVKSVNIYKDCNEQQKFPLAKDNCKPIASQCGEGTKTKQRTLLWNRKPGDANEPGEKCEVGKTAEGVLSAVGADKKQTLTAECKAGEFQGKCPIDCEWAPWSDGGIVSNAACPADSCSVKDAKQTITRTKKTVRQNGGKFCFQDEKGHFNEVSEACSYETTVSMQKAKMSSDKAKAEALAEELKKEMCKDGTGPCRNDATCDVQLNDDNTKVTSWCKCKTGFTGKFCEKDTRPKQNFQKVTYMSRTRSRPCPQIRSRTECLTSRDNRGWVNGQDCVYCIPGRNACPGSNVCEPGKWMEGRGKKAGIDFEIGLPVDPACKPRRTTNKKSCPEIKDKTECLESRDARTISLLGTQLKGQECVWCITSCPNGNVCEPGLWMESRGKKAGIDFEPCLK